jgi:hypothetical protein
LSRWFRGTFITGKKEEAVNKSFYLVSVAIGAILGAVLMAAGQMPLGVLLSLYAGVVALVMWYKAWSAIQDEHARTTPGKAVGFLFIPFFNLYWIFQAFWGFAKDYNSHLSRHGISVPELPAGLFLLYCILILVSLFMGWIPVVGSVIRIITAVILVVLVNSVCDAVNKLPQTVEQAAPPPSTEE